MFRINLFKKIKTFRTICRIKILDYINYFYDLYNFSILKPEIDELINIDPAFINSAVTQRLGKGYIKNLRIFDKTVSMRYRIGTSLDGDWDLNVHDLFTQKSGERIRLLMNIYGSKNSIEKKLNYQKLIYFLMENNKDFSLEKAEEEVVRSEEIYNSIIKNGFNNHYYQTYNFFHLKFKIKTKSGIRIAIGRDGEIIWIGSHHRMAIAKVIKFKSVPALVYYRHPIWQNKRKIFAKKLKKGNKLNIDKMHPDLLKIYNIYSK